MFNNIIMMAVIEDFFSREKLDWKVLPLQFTC